MNLTEGALTQYFSYPIEVNGGVGWMPRRPEAQLNEFNKFPYLPGPRRQITRSI